MTPPNPAFFLRHVFALRVFALLLSGSHTRHAALAAPPAAPASYQLHPALEMSLYAREPDVVSPVALTFDEAGRCYVVEMRDYPYGFGPQRKPGGTIRLLEDTDGDGKADRSVLFAEGLSFPTSVCAWNGGILVTAPPEIIFLKDTDGDGKADVREVMLQGFTLGVTDSNVNGLRWGLDNRVHGCNGGNGGYIRSLRKRGLGFAIRKLDFSFDPKIGDFAPTFHTSGGFGLVFDDWGHGFVTHNINHIQEQFIPARYLDRFPGLPPVQAVESISDHENMARIYPIAEPETRPNHPEQSGHFSASGGLGYIPESLRCYPGDLPGSILVCDVAANIVHRDVLSTQGPAFAASRAPGEQKSEFFASRDRACRPVGVELGPDGALYLIDMQRDVIEHPDYIPKKLREKLDIRAGDDRGRIYRITPKGGLPPRRPRLNHASASELVSCLGDSNQWWRSTAQRLLVERGDKTAVPALKELAEGTNALGRLHALWTLDGLGTLDEALVRRGLADAHPGIRENALLLAERLLPRSKELQTRVIALAKDLDARVRFQTGLTLGQIESPDVQPALQTIVWQDHEYRWSRVAVLSSLRSGESRLFRNLLPDFPNHLEASAARFDLLGELADLIAARSSASGSPALSDVVRLLAGSPFEKEWQIATLEGLQSGLARSGGKPLVNADTSAAFEKLLRTNSPALLAAAWKLSRTLGLPENETQRHALTGAAHQAMDQSRPVESRLEDIRLLSLGTFSAVGQTLFALLDRPEPTAIQLAALEALRQFNETAVASNLVARWRKLAPAVRVPVVNLLLQRTSFHAVLLQAMETDQIKVGELNLDLEQRRRLLRYSTPDIEARAARFIGDEEYSNRKTVVEEWLKKLPAQGDAVRGRAVFEKTCAPCHLLDGIGNAVGPDLASMSAHSVEDLLSNILDPNMAINPGYVAYNAETASGEVEIGLLQSETADSVQLLQANGRKVIIPRAQIKRFESSGVSLMPEGLEAGMTPADLRDLIALIQQKR
jgi:putative membrane-bound dehydrogenase-like protein